MRALYVEKHKSAFDRLSKFLGSKAPPSVAHACLHGDFVDLRDDILKWCGSGAFTFFFVDPKGWKRYRDRNDEGLCSARHDRSS